MQRPSSKAMMAAFLLLAVAGAARALEDGRAAVSTLEAALPDAPPERRPALLAELRKAYELAARQADADGQPREAQGYRDNLQILNRKAAAPAPATPAPVAKPSLELDPPPALPEPEAVPVPPPAPARPKPTAPAPVAVEEPPADDPIARADAAFRAGDYDNAGRGYAALARAHNLPADRRDHWAYCRMAGVVERINAGPRSDADWASLDAEIERIRALSPRNWFGEYLRNLVSRRPAPGRPEDTDKRVLRAAAPEESVASSRRKPAPEIKPVKAAPPQARAQTESGWQVRLTANFRILHLDPALAERVARAAEATREAQVGRWIGEGPRPLWTPKCDIYVYPDAASYARMTGQPEGSPGFSVMGQGGGKIVSRRVNLRADHPNIDTAILPHEVTHVVLADLFPARPLPRWADEGMAVLAEPTAEQAHRAKDLADPLAKNRLFPVNQLVAMDSPEDQHWDLYYAQSVSLTRFLVAQGTNAQFIKFLQASERNGFEPELKRAYKIDGYADLQARWLAYARAAPAEETASVDESERR